MRRWNGRVIGILVVGLVALVPTACGGSSTAAGPGDAEGQSSASTIAGVGGSSAGGGGVPSSTATTLGPVPTGPMPRDTYGDVPTPVLALPLESEVEFLTDPYSVFFADVGDPDGFRFTYQGSVIDLAWCNNYLDRVVASGIRKVRQFDDENSIIFMGTAANGFEVIIDCDPVAHEVVPVQFNPKSQAGEFSRSVN